MCAHQILDCSCVCQDAQQELGSQRQPPVTCVNFIAEHRPGQRYGLKRPLCAQLEESEARPSQGGKPLRVSAGGGWLRPLEGEFQLGPVSLLRLWGLVPRLFLPLLLAGLSFLGR